MQNPSATYQQLQSAFDASPGCPICHVGMAADRKYLDSLLWESVNDTGVRHELTQSLGLCSRHSRTLLMFPGGRLGVAILQRAIVQEALRQLQNQPAPAARSRLPWLQNGFLNSASSTNWAGDGAAAHPCPACVHQAAVEERALRELLAHLVADLDAPLRQGGGLCLPHLQQALRLGKTPQTRAVLVEIHSTLWSELEESLSQFIRKKDYRFQDEQVTDQERMAIDRSMAVLTGEYPIR